MAEPTADLHHDFDVNAQGRITEAQRAALVERYDRSAVITLLVAFGLIGALAALYAGLDTLGALPPDDDSTVALRTLLGCLWLTGLVACFGVGFFVSNVDKRRRTLPRVAAIAQQPVQQAEASIEWQRGGYKARVGPRWYPPIYGKNTLVTPGVYLVHITENPPWLFSARRQGVATPEAHDEALTRSLGRANGLNSDLLPVNRRGWLAGRQRLRLFRQVLRSVGSVVSQVWLIFIILLMVFVFGGLALASAQHRELTQGIPFTPPTLPTLTEIQADPSVLGPYLMGFAVALFLLFAMIRLMGNAGRLLVMLGIWLAGRVDQIEGELYPYSQVVIVPDSEGDDDRVTYYYYQIDRTHFMVSEAGFKVAPEGRRVRIYHFPLEMPRPHKDAAPYYLMVNIEAI